MSIRPRRRRRNTAVVSTVERSQQELETQVRSLLVEAQALSARLASLNEVAAAMQSTLDLDVVLQTLASQARWLIDFDSCSVSLREGSHYRILTLYHDAPPQPAGRYAVTLGLVGKALRNNHELLVQNMDSDPTLPSDIKAAIIVPLRAEREAVGTLNFFSNKACHYSQDDLRVVAALSLQISVILQNVRLFNAVTQARDELHTVLESIVDAVLVTDNNGRVLMINRSLRTMLQLPEIDFIGRRALLLLRLSKLSPTVRKCLVLHDIFTSHSAESSNPNSGELTLGNGVYIEWARVPLKGMPGGVVVTMRDVSARVELEQMRVDLTHTLVHDLRIPLTALIMGIEILDFTRKDGNSPLQEETFIRIRRSATQMIEHVNTILDVSKLETGQLILECTAQPLTPLVSEEIDSLVSLTTYSHQEIIYDVPKELPAVYVDSPLIRRVLTNLLGNALKFTQSKGIIQVHAHLTPARDMVEVQVIDNGPGISEDIRGRLFEKYVQASGANRRSGTGLGLFFCKLAVEAHGGKIGVCSAPEGGSIFWFTLPLA